MPLQGFWNNAGEIGLLTWPAELANPDAGDQTPFSIDELAVMLACDSREIARPGVLEKLYAQRDSVLMRWLDLNSKRLRLLVSLLENIMDPQTTWSAGISASGDPFSDRQGLSPPALRQRSKPPRHSPSVRLALWGRRLLPLARPCCL